MRVAMIGTGYVGLVYLQFGYATFSLLVHDDFDDDIVLKNSSSLMVK